LKRAKALLQAASTKAKAATRRRRIKQALKTTGRVIETASRVAVVAAVAAGAAGVAAGKAVLKKTQQAARTNRVTNHNRSTRTVRARARKTATQASA
jgi:mannitol-specific phosphotransferase system IIBC component